MNEISLSDDLNVITAEINSYKQVAGQALFEIGKRLKHVKENDLVHGEFMNWYQSLGFTKDFVSKTIRIVTELPNFESSRNLGIEALNLIATLPEEDREKEHTLSSGETKSVDEMTIRELQEIKKRLKETEQAKQQAERQARKAHESERIAVQKLEEAENREPEVVEKEVVKEVVPISFKEKLESAERKLNFINKENERLKQENDSYQTKNTEQFDEEEAKEELKKLHIEADRNTAEIRVAFKQLNDKVSISRYMHEAISAGSNYEKERMREEISVTKDIISEIEGSLKNRRVVN